MLLGTLVTPHARPLLLTMPSRPRCQLRCRWLQRRGLPGRRRAKAASHACGQSQRAALKRGACQALLMAILAFTATGGGSGVKSGAGSAKTAALRLPREAVSIGRVTLRLRCVVQTVNDSWAI